MKLKKLNIKNFRGINGDQNSIDFSKSDILFLIGKNNVVTCPHFQYQWIS
ncbi:hypothetical protein LEP1GSC202_3521 [Leptospira yanagawae serovar Saopaulo str. Sao Paulo = ATCC 700523]|uniref:Uncharacterized protein n=1 Tax=Leptospira yanagawae serovar Saopaulo str. Sao Paulo = ATCC 700523 TaxID=1249483 RepID=A0A5E8H9S4_9LEPT|nr:hypothetical protein LEP1GSC202_3521 [Leptospira yanagawae serovar Saopaulo str. Sao Paulo = ATCC 700523]